MIGHTKLLLLVGGAALAIFMLQTFVMPMAKTLPGTPMPIAPVISDIPDNQNSTYQDPTTIPNVPNNPTSTPNPYKSSSPSDPTQAVYQPQPTTPEDNASGPRPADSCTTNADCGGGCWRCDTTYGRCITVCNNEP
jgi:hypothetical protein